MNIDKLINNNGFVDIEVIKNDDIPLIISCNKVLRDKKGYIENTKKEKYYGICIQIDKYFCKYIFIKQDGSIEDSVNRYREQEDKVTMLEIGINNNWTIYKETKEFDINILYNFI